jgi:hypothetical protein
MVDGKMTTPPDTSARLPAGRWLAGLAAFGALQRLALWLVYSPVSYGDTPTYLRLADALGREGLAGYDATRVPGYPLLMLLLDGQADRIWAAQMLLGWGISLLLFWIGWKASVEPRVGFAIGMLYNLIPGLFLFEANLLSETLTMFTVVASLALWVTLRGDPERRDSLQSSWLLLLLLGLLAGAAGLVRTLFYVLAPLLALLLLREGAELRVRVARVALFSIGPLLLLGGWIGFVATQYGMLAPTTMGGGEYFELLPDEHAVIRDTYLKYRDERIAERGAQTNAIWDAIPELTEATGLSFFGLSEEMQRLSLELIRNHPDRYFRNVVEGWINFWKAPTIWDPGSMSSQQLANLVSTWALAGRAALLAAVSKRFRSRIGLNSVFLATAGLVWIASIVQTLVDHGDNPRFLVPLQIVVITVVVRAGYSFWSNATQREYVE